MGFGRGIYFWFSLHMFIEVCDWWRMVLQFRTEKSWIERLMFIETGCTGGTDYFGVGHHSSGLYSYIWIYIFAHDWHAWIYKELPTSLSNKKHTNDVMLHMIKYSIMTTRCCDVATRWGSQSSNQPIVFRCGPGEWLATPATSFYTWWFVLFILYDMYCCCMRFHSPKFHGWFKCRVQCSLNILGYP